MHRSGGLSGALGQCGITITGEPSEIILELQTARQQIWWRTADDSDLSLSEHGHCRGAGLLMPTGEGDLSRRVGVSHQPTAPTRALKQSSQRRPKARPLPIRWRSSRHTRDTNSVQHSDGTRRIGAPKRFAAARRARRWPVLTVSRRTPATHHRPRTNLQAHWPDSLQNPTSPTASVGLLRPITTKTYPIYEWLTGHFGTVPNSFQNPT